MDAKKKDYATVTIVYWFLLLYIVAVLVWWFIALQRQNNQMYMFRVQELKKDDPAYFEKMVEIEAQRKSKTTAYVGEGATFLLLTLVGAVFVYQATRRQIRLSHQQQNFMMAVTHELKTPIAVTRLNLETLQKRKLEEAQQQKLISNTLQEANRLNDLCNNILISSQLEAGAYLLNKDELDLSKLVDDCVHNFAVRYPQRQIEGQVQPELYVEGETVLLQMLVNNLVENALKYSPKEGKVTVVLKQKHQHAVLCVMDEGAGIPDAEKKRVFEKFYRIGSENTRKTKGTGLGLYLSKKIVNDHNGQIAVTDHLPNGSNFTVTLPLT
ncbi:sensor histidine kinase [Deminuibacter soli]|uniref:histidine kinase n=1 Tax=Deminuibacter soli TaxID=2291815 RepID=A0A3E1NDG5_9BACT|nr:HAMP domain-containing sensor histidine kinase [Deminuibacter soli]RFM25917.1 sensor histidine kinase [Deminuibacter soli]